MFEVPNLDHFDNDDAWQVGTALVRKCRDSRLPVTVSIWLGEQHVFHTALQGSSADNDSWVERKARTVRRFGCSSLEVQERYGSMGHDFFETFGLSPDTYTPSGGAVPILVRGAIVGVIAISGLESREDHDLAPQPSWSNGQNSPLKPHLRRCLARTPIQL
jgi:uncharacterized protein (UPF0303 family)